MHKEREPCAIIVYAFRCNLRVLSISIQVAYAEVDRRQLLPAKPSALNLLHKMPRPRQRIVTCDCFDCSEELALGPADTGGPSLAASDAAARQEPPPKCLFILASGFMQPSSEPGALSSLECAFLPHLDRCAQQGSLNLVACRPKAGSSSAAVKELQEVLGLVTEDAGDAKPGSSPEQQTLQARFKGMQAVLASNILDAPTIAAAAGMGTNSMLRTGSRSSSSSSSSAFVPGSGGSSEARLALPAAADLATGVLQELGLEQQSSGIDMLMLAVDLHQAVLPSAAPAAVARAGSEAADGGSSQGTAEQKRLEASIAALHWLDELVMQLSKSQLFRSTVLLNVLVTSQGQQLCAKPVLQPGGPQINPRAVVRTMPSYSLPPAPADAAAGLAAPEAAVMSITRPVQSFETLGGAPVKADLCAPMLLARRLPGVVRRDALTSFSLRECAEAAGQGALLVDRIIAEVAYKLGRALKYGA